MRNVTRRELVTAALVGCSARAFPGSGAVQALQGSATPTAQELIDAHAAQAAIRHYYRDNEAIEQFDIVAVVLVVFDTKEHADAFWTQSTAELGVPRPDDGVLQEVVEVSGVSSLGERTHIVIITGTDDEPGGIEIILPTGDEGEESDTEEPTVYLPSVYVTVQEGKIVASWETLSEGGYSYSVVDDEAEVAFPIMPDEEDYQQLYRLVYAGSRDLRDVQERYTRDDVFGMLAGHNEVPGGWTFSRTEDSYYQRPQ
jgi:hypothetical protein